MHYELGTNGDIAALLFAYPLLSPRPRTHNNKILWVSRISDNGSTLRISAQRMRGFEPIGHVVKRQVIGGPGPSIINLPTAGCWRLNLSWSGHHDVLDLIYVRNSDSPVLTQMLPKASQWSQRQSAQRSSM